MPELPDVVAYCHALTTRIVGQTLCDVRISNPFLLRTVDPPIGDAIGRRVDAVSRLGKRIVLALDGGRFLVFHLMIAGRFRWDLPGNPSPAKFAAARFQFPNGVLTLTEASSKKRASLNYLAGTSALATHAVAGLDVLQCDLPTFAAALRRENHTLKRSLTDPRLLDGIGNAYSDEILHAARLSPLALSQSLNDAEQARLFEAARGVLSHWANLLCERFSQRFPGPGEITAFRPEFAVHGKYGKPCPACGTEVQRIVYADNETNYCPRCQTSGRLLADRSLSRLLREDWPRSVDKL